MKASNKERVLKALETFDVRMTIKGLAHLTCLDVDRVRRTIRGLEAVGAVKVVKENGRLWVTKS